MKLRIGDLRQIISEEYLRGVPEFVIREETRKFVDGIRQQLRRHVFMTMGNPVMERENLAAANEVLTELEAEALKLVEQKLWKFMQMT